MFFVLSKLFWLVAHPLNLIGILIALGLVAVWIGWSKIALVVLSGALCLYLLAAWTTLGALALHPLEDRFARPDPAPAEIAGIIVLGGGFEGGINMARGGYELNSSGDRFVETAVLARRYPNVPIVISGGTGALFLEGEGDAVTAPRLLADLGVDRGRLILERRSRNTAENARFTRRLIENLPEDGAQGRQWLLVTSAFHMPRSVALFRKAGIDVVPWPADYRTKGTERFGLTDDNVMDTLSNSALAIREWVGLLAYRLTGRIDTILPARAGEAPADR